jgi:hypothetical protein
MRARAGWCVFERGSERRGVVSARALLWFVRERERATVVGLRLECVVMVVMMVSRRGDVM